MFLSHRIVKTRALRPSFPHLVQPLQQYRAQSTYDGQDFFWQRVNPWKEVSATEFISYQWQLRNTISDKVKLHHFLSQTLPDTLAPSKNIQLRHLKTRDDFIDDAIAAMKLAPMAIRLTPHILSRVNWEAPLDDPVRKQFLPLKSALIPDHKQLTMDSLNEENDSPTPGLVKRYPGRALFLATSICPVYCRFCTRSYAVGANTETVSKKPQKPSRRRWENVFQYIESDSELKDIVVSGGDAYYLNADNLKEIGERLLQIPHIRRIRFASKGLAVAPGRILDEFDAWTATLIDLSNQGRQMGKHVCLHTHINHANEINWITTLAANKLFKHGVVVRNQSVLLKGVNDSAEALQQLIEGLADINIQPYYVYQCDMVQGVEDLRTTLQQTIDLDKQLRGTLSGFMMPSFVVDLPGGGGKRLVSTYETYQNGVATYKAPGLAGAKGEMSYSYHDPQSVTNENPISIRAHQEIALPSTLPWQTQSQSEQKSSCPLPHSSPTRERMPLEAKTAPNMFEPAPTLAADVATA